VGSIPDFIFSLNNQGYLLKKGPNAFQVVCVSANLRM
jgi:hypothetical protein